MNVLKRAVLAVIMSLGLLLDATGIGLVHDPTVAYAAEANTYAYKWIATGIRKTCPTRYSGCSNDTEYQYRTVRRRRRRGKGIYTVRQRRSRWCKQHYQRYDQYKVCTNNPRIKRVRTGKIRWVETSVEYGPWSKWKDWH